MQRVCVLLLFQYGVGGREYIFCYRAHCCADFLMLKVEGNFGLDLSSLHIPTNIRIIFCAEYDLIFQMAPQMIFPLPPPEGWEAVVHFLFPAKRKLVI